MKKRENAPETAENKNTPKKHGVQRTPLKKRRAGIELSREEVKAIKNGRRKLRRELRKKGIRGRKDFELTASSLGLYFDKNRALGLLLWLFHGRGLLAVLAASTALLLVLFGYSMVSQMQGHFTINLSGDLLREGFSLSETKDFKTPSMRLFAEPATEVPCYSLADIHDDVNDVDGQHNEAGYFAYTFYIRNEGENSVDYTWELIVNAESHDLSKATWIMFFEDDTMRMFARKRDDGGQEALPSFGDDSRGYLRVPMIEHAADAESLYQPIITRAGLTYYRVVPEAFEDEDTVASGERVKVPSGEIHKYTVAMWIEGDDPDCTDELIGGHAGVEMRFYMSEQEESDEEADSGVLTHWENFWDSLLFWKG